MIWMTAACVNMCVFCMFHEYEVLYAAQVPGTTQDHLQVFNIETKAKMKSHQMKEQV